MHCNIPIVDVAMQDLTSNSGTTVLESFWVKEALASDAETSPPLDGDARADVCIVGGGYTGLWTAIRLKTAAPETDVLLIEAKRCGSGGSGANAGFVAPYWVHFSTFRQMAGTDEAVRLCRAAAEVSHEIEDLMSANHADIQLQRNGTIWGATCERQLGRWDEAIEALGATPALSLRASRCGGNSKPHRGRGLPGAGCWSPTTLPCNPRCWCVRCDASPSSVG